MYLQTRQSAFRCPDLTTVNGPTCLSRMHTGCQVPMWVPSPPVHSHRKGFENHECCARTSWWYLSLSVLGGQLWCRLVNGKAHFHSDPSRGLPSPPRIHIQNCIKCISLWLLQWPPPPRGCPKIPVGAQRTARIKSCTYVESCLLIYGNQLPLALPDGPALKFLDRGDINQSHNSDFNPTPRHHRSLSEGRSCCSLLDSPANSTSCMHSLGKSGQTSSDCITLPETAHNLKWMNGLFL